MTDKHKDEEFQEALRSGLGQDCVDYAKHVSSTKQRLSDAQAFDTWMIEKYGTAVDADTYDRMWEAWMARADREIVPEPFGYFRELLDHNGKGKGIWLGCPDKTATEQFHIEGETGEEIITLFKMK